MPVDNAAKITKINQLLAQYKADLAVLRKKHLAELESKVMTAEAQKIAKLRKSLLG